jgi:hypothetical protein
VGSGTFSLPTQTITSTSVVTQAGATGVVVSTTTVTSIIASYESCSATAGGVVGAQATNNPPSASCPNCLTREVAIGVGVGFPLSAALVASLILLLLRGKREKSRPPAAPPTISQPAMIRPYPVTPKPPPGPFSSGYPTGEHPSGPLSSGYPTGGHASGVSQYDQYPSSPGGVGGYARPRDPVDLSPIRAVSPDTDGEKYELGHQGDIGRGSPPTYLNQGKR